MQAESGDVYWAGLKLVFLPSKVELPLNKKAASVGACTDSFAVVTCNFLIVLLIRAVDNEVYMLNEFAPQDKHYPDYSLSSNDVAQLFSNCRKIVQIGGTYHNRYAIVE